MEPTLEPTLPHFYAIQGADRCIHFLGVDTCILSLIANALSFKLLLLLDKKCRHSFL
jgi:hypothetical protein